MVQINYLNRQSQPSVNGYQSQFFNQSNGKSTIIYKQMMDDNVSTNSLREFLHTWTFNLYSSGFVLLFVSIYSDFRKISLFILV